MLPALWLLMRRAAGIEAHIFMPRDVPLANRVECETYGAQVTLVDGLISDCARMVAERKEKEGWFDVSTLKEPFRVEGKKTMGYEVAEQLKWKMPQGIIYPTRRRGRAYRHVEGIRRDGNPRLDRPRAPQNGLCAVCWLRPDC